MNINFSKNYSIDEILEKSIVIRDWILNGLPHDSVSVENSIIAMKSEKWPFFIDPQGIASRWIKNIYREKDFYLTKLTDNNFVRILQSCINKGYTLLIEDLSEKLEVSIGM